MHTPHLAIAASFAMIAFFTHASPAYTAPRPKVMPPDHVFASFRAVTVLPLSPKARVSFDENHRTLRIDNMTQKAKIREEFLARAGASPHVGHIERLGKATYIFWLRSMRTEAVLLAERSRKKTKLVLGERRNKVAPRAMFLGSQCALMYTEVESVVLDEVAQAFCQGMLTPPLIKKLEDATKVLRGRARRYAKLMRLDVAGKGVDELEHLAMRHSNDPSFVAQVWLSIAMGLVRDDRLEDALTWLELGEKMRKKKKVRWSPQRLNRIQTLGQGIFLRLTLAHLVDGDDTKVVKLYTKHRSWEGDGLVRLRHRIINAHRRAKQPARAATLFTELLNDPRLSSPRRRAIHGDLATCYVESNDPYRAWATYRYLLGRWGAPALQNGFPILVRWLLVGRDCTKMVESELCDATKKPDPTTNSDIVFVNRKTAFLETWVDTSTVIAH